MFSQQMNGRKTPWVHPNARTPSLGAHGMSSIDCNAKTRSLGAHGMSGIDCNARTPSLGAHGGMAGGATPPGMAGIDCVGPSSFFS